MNPAPRFYEGPIKLLPRKAERSAAPADHRPTGRREREAARRIRRLPREHEQTDGARLSPSPRSLIVAVGAMLLMLAEAFQKKRRGDSGLALGAAIVFFGGAAFAGGGVDLRRRGARRARAVAPWLVIDRFSLFFDVVLCLGGALAALLAGGLPAGAQPRARRVLLAPPLLDVRRDDARRRGRHADGLPRPRDDVHRRLRDDRVPARVARVGRGGAQVLPARLVRRGAPPLRLRAPLRGDGAHRPRRDRRRAQGGARRRAHASSSRSCSSSSGSRSR